MLHDEEMEQDIDFEMTSEKEIMLRLYRIDRNTREVMCISKLNFIYSYVNQLVVGTEIKGN